MKMVWQKANPTEWLVVYQCPTTLSLHKRDALNVHCAKAGEQKCSAEALSYDFPVYLLGRFVDSQFPQNSGELFVCNATSHHLQFNKFFRRLFPSLVGLCSLPNHTRQFVHRTFVALKPSLLFWYLQFSHYCNTSYTTHCNKLALYVLANYFCEDKLLTKPLPRTFAYQGAPK